MDIGGYRCEGVKAMMKEGVKGLIGVKEEKRNKIRT